MVDGETVHTPPPSNGLGLISENSYSWVNSCHNDIESNGDFHPLIKALTLHFSVGFEHLFRDGNGRVARSLFIGICLGMIFLLLSIFQSVCC